MNLSSCPRCRSDDVTGRAHPRVTQGYLYWVCEYCNHAWPRMFVGRPRLRIKSQRFAAEHNRRVNA